MIDEHEHCAGCGDDLFDDGEDCLICDEGPFCWDCLKDHEADEHTPKCHACGVKLEVDPPCPICHQEFCEGCISGHVALCQQKEDIHTGVQPTLYSFIFEDGLT